MSPANRLPPPAGRRIDRTRPVAVTFEGRRYQGLAGRLHRQRPCRERRLAAFALVQVPPAARGRVLVGR